MRNTVAPPGKPAFLSRLFPMPLNLVRACVIRRAGPTARDALLHPAPGRRRLAAVLLAALGCMQPVCPAADPATAPARDASGTRLFAVQIRTGPKWDAAKPPPQQPFFAEHSANLRRLREKGHLVLGARYAEVGLVVLSAASEAEARAMMDEDPSFRAGVFVYEVHPFNVFYPGTVEAPRKAR